MASSTARVLVGVDIGGTSVKVGIVDLDGRVLARSQAPVDRQDSVERVVANAKAQIEKLLQELKLEKEAIHAVGVACPGVTLESGVIHAANNFPTWSDAPLQRLMQEALGKPAKVVNDADAAILAELWVGCAKDGIHDFIMITLGTGVGYGVIVNGQLVQGGTNTVEGGHIIVERNGRLCGCSQRGCLEAYSSALALVTEAQEHLTAGADSLLSRYPVEKIDAELIFKVAAEGDAMCNRLIEEAAEYLGFACVNFSRSLDPQLIVLAGGIAEAGETFLTLVRAGYAKYAWTTFPNPVKIEKAKVGYDSGIIGAAAVVRPH